MPPYILCMSVVFVCFIFVDKVPQFVTILHVFIFCSLSVPCRFCFMYVAPMIYFYNFQTLILLETH